MNFHEEKWADKSTPAPPQKNVTVHSRNIGYGYEIDEMKLSQVIKVTINWC